MEGLGGIGKMLLYVGLAMGGLGLLLMAFDKVPFVGKLPGDFLFKGEKVTFYFPLATSILLSIVLTLLFSFFGKK